MSEERFWNSTPSELEPYATAHAMRVREQTEAANFTAWLQGLYFKEAIATSVFVANLPEKRMRLPKYPKEPCALNFEQDNDKDKPMTEEQIKMAQLRERIKMDSVCRALKERFAKRG